jgi:protoporphyrinogen oxidase
MRVGIIGGGVSGLALAWLLGGEGAEVEIFERGSELGGLAAGFEVMPGVRLERFYHHIFQTDTDFIDAAGRLGFGDRIMWRPTKTAFYMQGAVHALGTALDVLRFRPLGLPDRIALAATTLELKARSRGRGLDVITIEEFFRRRFAARVYETVWRPMLEAKWGEDKDRLAAAWLWQKIRARGNSRAGSHESLGYPLGGFGVLSDALAAQIAQQGGKVRLGAEVHRILTAGGRVTGLQTTSGSVDFDAIVSTLPLPNLLPLVDEIDPATRARMLAIPYRGVLCQVLVMDRPLSDIYWLNVADRSIPLGGVIEHTNFVPASNYDGRSIAYLFNYAPQDSLALSMSPDEAGDLQLPHLNRIFPAFRPAHILDRFVFGTRVATPVYRHPYTPPPLEPLPGLFLADTSQIFPQDRGTSECIRLARFVASNVMGRPAARPGPV